MFETNGIYNAQKIHTKAYDTVKMWTFNTFFLIIGNNNAATNDNTANDVFIIPDVDDDVNYGIIHEADY